ncbi:MAG: adenylate/guanylate cyclase domain-containing protein [Spirochaetales bacterium]|nr:adenylate/guanylate cyclase domain-containing protein [Spirochaetales bacterium]
MQLNDSQRSILALQKEIEEYYLPKQLIDAISDIGAIPRKSEERIIGIGFLDISDYSYLAKFLSAHENQTILNGLYSAFNWVLKKHGGYLNKIEGDSLMFHYGGPIDPKAKNMTEDEERHYVARELFYTSVEMQRVCTLFNHANDNFLLNSFDQSTRTDIEMAYKLIKAMRNSGDLSATFNALFQIRIRIGCNVGSVMIGNFGPEGAKHWDVIGHPVIEAKRMESSAPVGGLRITRQMYEILKDEGVTRIYLERFRREAGALFGAYKNITEDELFKESKVYLKDKKNVSFNTYSVQVNPGLPEDIHNQMQLLLQKGEAGADRIIEMFTYYRGNRFIINKAEELFETLHVNIRKNNLLRLLIPEKFKAFLLNLGGDEDAAAEKINRDYSLYRIFEVLGALQDKIKEREMNEEKMFIYSNYDEYIKSEREWIISHFNNKIGSIKQSTYFYDVIFPLIFKNIKSSILEYQQRMDDIEDIEEL